MRSEANDVLKEVPADDAKEASSDDEEDKDAGDAEEEVPDEKEEQPEEEEPEQDPAEESEVEESEDPEGISKYTFFPVELSFDFISRCLTWNKSLYATFRIEWLGKLKVKFE